MEYVLPSTKWIWAPGKESLQFAEPRLALFRRSFTVPQDSLEEVRTRGLRIRISADTRYKLYCNGVLLQIGPSKGDNKEWFYDEVDLTSSLRAGENVLAAEVLHYPVERRMGNHSLFRTSTPGLYVEELVEGTPEPTEQTTMSLVQDAADPKAGGRLGLTADGQWKCRFADRYHIVSESPGFAPLQILERTEGDAALHGWKKPGFDDSGWEAARPYNIFEISTAVVPGNLLKRTIPYMYRAGKTFAGVHHAVETDIPTEQWNAFLREGSALAIPPHRTEIVEIDAGLEETGFLSLRMCGGAGAHVQVLCAECYVYADPEREKDPFYLPKKGDRTDFEKGVLRGYTDEYTAAGCGTAYEPERYEPFWFRTFRYIRLTVTTGDEPLELRGFDYEETGYPLEVKTHVKTSDPTLDAVWKISETTLRRCMQETYTDCPFYEQLQYAMDSRSQILYTYMVSADDRLARKCMRDFKKSQRYDGMINCDYPCYEPNVIPGFSIYYILMLHDHMMFFGDKAFLSEFPGCIDGILHFFDARLTQDGLVGKIGGENGNTRYWSFIDWTTQWDSTSGVPTATRRGPITMESLLYILGLDAAADIMAYLGRVSTAEEYRRRADQVREAVRTHCIGENGMIMDGPGVPEYSQHGQVFAILTGTIDTTQGRKNLLETLDHKEQYAQCSVAMAYYLFRAMQKTGLYERTDEIWNIWRDMVRCHLTTCVEDGVNGRSDCHAWGSLALYELPAVVLGVAPAAPGFAEVSVDPEPGFLTSAEGDVVTPRGMLHVAWTKDATTGKLSISKEWL